MSQQVNRLVRERKKMSILFTTVKKNLNPRLQINRLAAIRRLAKGVLLQIRSSIHQRSNPRLQDPTPKPKMNRALLKARKDLEKPTLKRAAAKSKDILLLATLRPRKKKFRRRVVQMKLLRTIPSTRILLTRQS